MLGLMMDRPLLISRLIEFAEQYHGSAEIVSHTVEKTIHRYTYADAGKRIKKLANALKKQGIQMSDRIGTLAWNTYRHFEIYFAVSGMGAVCHTINPRLFPEQLVYIINHGEDRHLFVDTTFVPLIEKLWPELTTVQSVIVMADRAHMPTSSVIPNLVCYEEFIAGESEDFDWPEFDENTASSLCYTSGTTGNPKGVLFSHRANMLHTYAAALPDAMNISARDAILPIVPMFHVNAWGIPYIATMTGAKLVMPGPHLDGESVHMLIKQEGVTFSAAVPTVWLMLFAFLEKNPSADVAPLKCCIIGGSACPRAMMETFRHRYGVEVRHAWGMTEMSPLGTINTPLKKHDALTDAEYFDLAEKQGRPLFGVEMKIVDDDGKELPRDGVAFGDLKVRGPWIAKAYFRLDQSAAHDAEGWFSTGDVGTLDPDGYFRITDRTKDVIKSGGEWISSIDLENIAVGHPAVAEAAVIGVRHPKWDERPLLLVVRKGSATVDKDEILRFFDGKIAKWWMPDDVVFVPELPHTATGKLLKTKLRDEFASYVLPTA